MRIYILLILLKQIVSMNRPPFPRTHTFSVLEATKFHRRKCGSVNFLIAMDIRLPPKDFDVHVSSRKVYFVALIKQQVLFSSGQPEMECKKGFL